MSHTRHLLTRRPRRPLTSIAERVRFLRAQFLIPRWKAALDAGVSQGWLSSLEQGAIQEPSPRKLAKLAPALRTTYLDLCEAAGYAPMPTIDDPELRDLIVLLMGMEPRERRRWLRTIWTFLDEGERKPRLQSPKWIS